MKGNRTLIYLIVAATLLKLVSVFFISQINLWEDHDIAVNLLETGEQFYSSDGTKLFSFQFPVYPFFVACIYKIFGISSVAVVVFNVLLNGFTAYIIFLFINDFIRHFLSVSVLSRYAEKISGACLLIFLLHPAINYYALYNVHPFSMDLFFLFLSLWLMMKFVLNPTGVNLAMYSIALGLTMLDRASLVVVLLPFMLMSYTSGGFIAALKRFSVIVLLSSLIVLPWLIRNYYKDGIWGFESSITKNLWKGSMQNGEGTSYLVNGNNYYSALTDQERHGMGKMNPKEQHDFFLNKYLDLWKEDPGHVLKMYCIKLKNFWWFRDNIGNDYGQNIQSYIIFYKVYFVIILLFSIVSLFLIRGSVILFSVPFALAMLQAIFYVETRHRMIIEPILIFLSALAIADLYLRYGKKSQ